jgi:hypothetical protein
MLLFTWTIWNKDFQKSKIGIDLLVKKFGPFSGMEANKTDTRFWLSKFLIGGFQIQSARKKMMSPIFKFLVSKWPGTFLTPEMKPHD